MGMESMYNLSVVLRLTDNLSPGIEQAGATATQSVNKMNGAFDSMQKAGTVLAGTGAAILGVGLSTVTATFDTQNALGELSSLGVEDLQAVEAAAKNFSDTWAGTSKSDFISASYDIKSGIASLTDEGIAQFTELAALTGKATKSTTEEMGSLFATGYGIYKGAYEDMSDLEFGEMFSAGISTAVKNYKTAGSQMASAISALGATATNNNVPLEEQLAILGQLQTTMGGSEAATKYRAFLNAAATAGEKLGLTFTDANNQLLSTPEILEQLKGKYGDTIDAVEKVQIKEAFGTDEAVAMIDLLYKDIDGLSSGIDSMAASMSQGTAATKEMAEAINNTPEQKFTVIKQQIHNNVEALGNSLLPAVNETMDKISGVIEKGSEWISNNQETVSSIMNIGMKLGVFLIIIGTVIGGLGTFGKTISNAKAAISLFRGVWTGLSAAFTASPVGWVVIAIVALIAAFALLWNKSEAFRNFWLGLFDQVKGAVLQAWGTIQPALQKLGGKIMELYEAAKPILEIIGTIAGIIGTIFVGKFVGAIQGVLAALTPLVEALSSLVSFVTNIINAIVALFKGDFAGACDFASAALGNLKDFFFHIFDAVTSFIGGFADGFLDTIGGALSAVGIDAGDTIGKMKETIHNGLESVKGFFGNILGAAGDTAKEKMNNIKNAFTENGGGMRGAAAAALEGVKSIYSSGLTFIDNLTGGKLSSIKEAFTTKLDAARQAVQSAVDKIKSIFNFDWSLPKLKTPSIKVTGGFSISPPSAPKFSVKWNAKGGIMTKPTIFGMAGGQMLGGGEAGNEAILPLAAFWDKLGNFIKNALAEKEEKNNTSEKAGMLQNLLKRETKSIESKQVTENKSVRYGTDWEANRTVIQKIELNVNLEKIKELPMLIKLIDELKDAQNGSGKDDLKPA